MKLKIIGKGSSIDKNAIVGYKPARNVAVLKLVIGKNAVIRSGAIVYAGTSIGDNLETGHNVVIREENIIGSNLQVWSNSVIDYGCKIGNNVLIHCNCYVCQYTVIEDDVFLAPGVSLANDKHPINKAAMKGPIILNGARIGINSVILPGVRVGRNSTIGAGSVVTKDIPDRSVAFGVPAKVVCSIDKLK